MTDKKNGEQESLQQIFYGAPGTGKSYKIKKMIGENVDHIRTTFHPDSDYSTFVGAYKPTMDRLPIYDNLGQPVLIAGSTMNKEQITYKFVPQAFLKAYVGAWEKYNGVNEIEKVEDEILVIEEINRGNCAQIFGDLFQLLDRNEKGFSEYPITADADMKKYLKKAFENINLNEEVKKKINDFCKCNKDICKQVLEGEILLLPNNLYIWATMNTSDQSLFPIDSAFKRRWDWQYVPISDARKNWVISVNGSEYDWWEFLQRINKRIYDATFSEDKQLGYFFCKAKDGVIDAKTFVGKVIFYLWNDVFKDMDSDLFTYEDGGEKKKLTFGEFYKVDSNGEVVVNDSNVETLLNDNPKLELESIEPGTRSKDVKFKVIYNGKEYNGTGVDILEGLVKDIGVERIWKLRDGDNRIAGTFLIVDDNMKNTPQLSKYIKNLRPLENGKYLFSKTSNTKKIEQINEIAKRLNLDLEVVKEII